jgi:hypothetical protein
VLAHENKHAAINRKVVQCFAEPMRKALQEVLGTTTSD